jgi:hypothetical protein
MTNEIQLNTEKSLASQDFINKITELEKLMLNSDLPGIIKFSEGDSDIFPLTHSFSEGIYVREMFIPAGGFLIGKIQKFSHTVFLLKGKIIIATENGTECYTAPCYINATEGTKRAGYAIEDTIWVNVHPNQENITDIKILEDTLACTSYDEYNKYKLLNR